MAVREAGSPTTGSSVVDHTGRPGGTSTPTASSKGPEMSSCDVKTGNGFMRLV